MSGADLIQSAYARTERSTQPNRAISSPGGAVRSAYEQTRRIKQAPYSREDVFARWGHACAYCWGVAEHLDHVQPLARGGRDELSNVVPACADCNLAKGVSSLADWAQVTDSLGAQHRNEGERQ